MTPVTIDLPEDLAKDAAEAGLFTPAAVEALFRDGLRRFHLGEFLRLAKEFQAAKIPPMAMDEIQEEVNAVRAEKRQRAARF